MVFVINLRHFKALRTDYIKTMLTSRVLNYVVTTFRETSEDMKLQDDESIFFNLPLIQWQRV